MAYDEGLAERVREQLADVGFVTEKKMFGGLVFMVNGNMLCGIMPENLMLRVGPHAHEDALAQPHAIPMDFTKRKMTGFIYVEPEGIEADEDLAIWLNRGLDFAGRLPPK